MNKHNIQDYTDFYATFMRIKDSNPKQDYIVVLTDGKDKGEHNENDGEIFN
jgi:hypothetical protein